ncbi:MAG: tetratricopeptide repeat protein [Planctomycetes bacterium]|nr:tetratricopeptide repeat protein [Planctomycetota bacterium]
MSAATDPHPQPLASARKLLASGEPARAIQLVARVLRDDPDAREAYELAAEALERQVGSGPQALLFRRCHEDFADPRSFYELGFDFLSGDLPDLARPLLDRAFRLAPNDVAVRVEYAVALAETGDHAAASRVLEELPAAAAGDRPSLVFLAAWCRLLTGDADGAARGKERLDRLARSTPVDAMLRERLELGLERLRALGRPPGPQDLRGWHFVQYGGALLTTRAQAGTGGRYGVLVESFEALGQRLAILIALLRRLGLAVARIATPAAQDADILGRALAARLHVPAVPWPTADSPGDGTTLVCAASVDDLGAPAALVRRAPTTVLYVHRLAWTRSAAVVPDVTGLMARVHFLPWGRTLQLDAASRRVFEQAADPRPPAEIAAHVGALIPEPPAEDAAAVLACYVRHRALSLYAGDERVTLRPGFRQESPVRSGPSC